MVTDRQGQGCCKETSEVGSRLFSQDGHFCHDIGFAYFRSGSFELNILTTQETDFFVVEFEFDGFFFFFFSVWIIWKLGFRMHRISLCSFVYLQICAVV